MRIHESCVSSEDIKLDSGACRVLCFMSLDAGILLVGESDKHIGYIDRYKLDECLGDDIVIEKIVIRGNQGLSEKLTARYTGKILILSRLADDYV